MKLTPKYIEKLHQKQLITDEQFAAIGAYHKREIFSLHGELKLLLYISVLLITSGISTIVYKNIDSIGHLAILGLLLGASILAYLYAYKNSPNFTKQEVIQTNTFAPYTVLGATILSGVFIGYLQFQYQILDTSSTITAFCIAIISFAASYYFDNKSVLSIAITSLSATVGLSVYRPLDLQQALTLPDNNNLSISSIILGFTLIIWTYYQQKKHLKIHFNFLILIFAQQFISFACLINMIDTYNLELAFFTILLTAFTSCFYIKSRSINAISLYFFTILYAYLGICSIFWKLFENSGFSNIIILLLFIMPIYFLVSLIVFVKLIKNFKKRN